MSTPIKVDVAGLQSQVEHSWQQTIAKQIIFALVSAAICLALSLGIADAIVLSPRPDPNESPISLVHRLGYLGELATASLGFFVPSRLLKYGVLSLAVLLPLSFILLAEVAFYTPAWCDCFGYNIVKPSTAAQILAISSVILLCKAKFSKNTLTSFPDAVFSCILFVAYILALGIFFTSIPLGDGYK